MKPAVIPGSSIAAARALLDWTQTDLAHASGLHANSCAYWERAHAIALGPSGPVTFQRMHKALRKAGVEITAQGVQFVQREMAAG